MDGVTIHDLREVRRDGEWWYTFKWRGLRWEQALLALKDAIRFEDWEYDSETHVWSVRATAATALDLCTIFANFWPAVLALRSQRRLFEEDV